MLPVDKKALVQSIKNGLIHSFKLDNIQFNVIPNNIYYVVEKIKKSNNLDSLEIID